MNRTDLLQLVKKEFAIPRDLLKISLYVSGLTNLALIWLVFVNWANTVEVTSECERIAFAAGSELARSDLHGRKPRHLRLKVVDFTARATYTFEETQETYRGLPVWEWRWAHPIASEETLILPQHMLNAYNNTTVNLLKRELNSRR